MHTGRNSPSNLEIQIKIAWKWFHSYRATLNWICKSAMETFVRRDGTEGYIAVLGTFFKFALPFENNLCLQLDICLDLLFTENES